MSDPAEVIYEALHAGLGVVVTGSAKALRETRARLLASDPAVADLLVLGPSPQNEIFLVRKTKLLEQLNG